MKMIKLFFAMMLAVLSFAAQAGESAPFLLDTVELLSAPITYNSSWVGGDSSAEVVISADGKEIKRTSGEGDFTWMPTTSGKHTLTYTTYINGVAQGEAYTAMVFKDWKYTVWDFDSKATVVGTTLTSGSVTIPSEIDGYPVVVLDDGLFNGCEGITSITIPGNLVTRMAGLFPDSYGKLTNVTLTGEVTKIPDNTFAGCVALETFVIPDGVTQIGDNAFSGCKSMTEIVIPDSVYSIGVNTFSNCTELQKVSMPIPLKEQIEAGSVFAGCSKDLEIIYRAAEIRNVVAKQRYPWNGKVDIKFEVVGDVNAGLHSENPAELSVTAKDSVTGEEWIAKTVSGDTGTNQGEHHVVWDMKADGLSFYSANIKFKVAYSVK